MLPPANNPDVMLLNNPELVSERASEQYPGRYSGYLCGASYREGQKHTVLSGPRLRQLETAPARSSTINVL